jgi:hypothetical protein
MSSAEIAAVEMAAVGAALALSAALGGAGIALQGLGGLAAWGADRMQSKADAKRAAREQVLRYEQLVRDVLDRHARIDALAESVRRAERDHGVSGGAAIPQVAEAQSHLTDVRVRIQEANTQARAAREAALTAARCLRGLAGYQAPGVPEAHAALAEVVAGRRPLDEPLRAEAAGLVAAAQAERERRYVAAALSSALAGLGYRVGEGFETLTARDGEVFITRGDWPAHAVKLKLGENQELRFAVMRTKNGATRQDQRLDAERERAWCDSFEQVRATLADRGVHTTVRWRLEPGTQRLPVAAGRTVSPKAEQRHRERE